MPRTANAVLVLSPRGSRFLAVALAVILVPIVTSAALYAAHVVDVHPLIWYGIDLEIMRELGRRWLESGTMYLPYQLAGPYSVEVTPNLATTPALYPPAAGPLFALVSLLPWPVAVAFWWGVPLAIVGYAVARWRPSPLACALALLMFAHPMTSVQLMVGGTSMWAAALVAAGLLWHWPAALILVKPTLLPFALIGSRHRSWWLAAGVVVVAMLLGPWRDYVTVALNGSDSGGGIGYSLASVPILLVPVILWLGASRPTDSGPALLDPHIPVGRRGVLDGQRARRDEGLDLDRV